MSSVRIKLPARFHRLVFSLVMGAIMAFIMTFSLTLINQGLSADFVSRWLHTYLVAYPIAATAIFAVAPIARRITARLVDA